MPVRFLIIRFSSIGDIVLTTPVIRNLKQQVEGAEVHYLTKKQFVPVLQKNPYIDKLWVLDGNLTDLIREIKYSHIDYVIDLHNNLRTIKVKRKLGAISFTFNKINVEKWMMVNFKKDRLPRVHIVDRYMETVKSFDVSNDMKGLDYYIDEEDQISNEIRSNLPDQFVTMAIGAQHYTKKAPPVKLAEIIQGIKLPVVLLGGPTDVEASSKIRALAQRKDLTDLCGKISLNQSAILVRDSALLITHDTGMMHIGAALKKNIFSIWGNTIPEFGMYPYLPGEQSRIFEIQDLECRPCSKIGFNKCPKKHFDCMMKQDSAEIPEAANRFIEQ